MSLLLAVQALGLLCVLVGAHVRGRLAISWLFGAYLAVGVLHKTWQVSQGADGWLVWLAVDLAQGVCCIGALVEIGNRAFHRALPGGRQQVARRFLMALSVGLALIILWGVQLQPTDAGELYDALVEVSRRVAVTVLVLSTILLGLAFKSWALDPWHREIALGLWLYNAAIALLSPRLGLDIPTAWPAVLYSPLLVAWAWAAWRPHVPHGWSVTVTRLVWPWRA